MLQLLKHDVGEAGCTAGGTHKRASATRCVRGKVCEQWAGLRGGVGMCWQC